MLRLGQHHKAHHHKAHHRKAHHHKAHSAYDLALDRFRQVSTVPGLELIGLMRQSQVLIDQKKYLDAAAVLERALSIEDNEELRALLQRVKKLASKQNEPIDPPNPPGRVAQPE
ncbi:MAG: hypothetical protein RLZ98_3544 [Pseudomonadota bacterium]